MVTGDLVTCMEEDIVSVGDAVDAIASTRAMQHANQAYSKALWGNLGSTVLLFAMAGSYFGHLYGAWGVVPLLAAIALNLGGLWCTSRSR